MLKLEQNIIEWMKHLVSKLYKPAELVVDTTASTSATAKEYSQLTVHRRLAEDVLCFHGVSLLPMVVHSKQACSPET